MNFVDYLQSVRPEAEIIAYFGQARLVRRSDSQYELLGGSEDDWAAAREWISLFMHEAVLTLSPA